jgi:hypothetical protein
MGCGSGANSHDEYLKISPLYKCCSHDRYRYHTLSNTIETVKQGWENLRPGHELETCADSLTGSGTQQNVLPIARESIPKKIENCSI